MSGCQTYQVVEVAYQGECQSMGKSPLVTVYIPTYNRMRLLRRAVESVLRQDYDNIELIVVDDGSTDGTVNFLYELSQIDIRVRYFINSENSGACVSRNKAIAAALGDFITGLDDDDYFVEDRVSRFVLGWKKKRSCSIALYSNARIIRKKDNEQVTNRKQSLRRADLFEKNYVGNQVFLRTETLRRIGGFDEALPAWQDYDCWIRLLSNDDDQMELVPAASYVIDISHSHERIGTGARGKKYEAFTIMAKKLKLKGRRLASLEVNFCQKGKLAPPLMSVVLKILLSWHASNIIYAIKVYYRSKIYKWPKYSRNGIYSISNASSLKTPDKTSLRQ